MSTPSAALPVPRSLVSSPFEGPGLRFIAACMVVVNGFFPAVWILLTSLSFTYHDQAAKLLKDVMDRQSALKSANSPTTLQAVLDFQKKADKLQGDIQRGWPGPGKPKPTFTNTNAALGTLGEYVNQADQAPTEAMRTAYRDLCQDLTKLTQQWSQLMSQDLPAMNSALTQQKMQAVEAVSLTPAVPGCQ